MFDDILSEVRNFSRQTGIVDKNVDLLLDGLCKFPARLFLFTPFNEPVYYGYDPAKEFKKKFIGEWPEWVFDTNIKSIRSTAYAIGRDLALNNKPRGRDRFTGISTWS